jgi:hypothetical protein
MVLSDDVQRDEEISNPISEKLINTSIDLGRELDRLSALAHRDVAAMNGMFAENNELLQALLKEKDDELRRLQKEVLVLNKTSEDSKFEAERLRKEVVTLKSQLRSLQCNQLQHFIDKYNEYEKYQEQQQGRAAVTFTDVAILTESVCDEEHNNSDDDDDNDDSSGTNESDMQGEDHVSDDGDDDVIIVQQLHETIGDLQDALRRERKRRKLLEARFEELNFFQQDEISTLKQENLKMKLRLGGTVSSTLTNNSTPATQASLPASNTVDQQNQKPVPPNPAKDINSSFDSSKLVKYESATPLALNMLTSVSKIQHDNKVGTVSQPQQLSSQKTPPSSNDLLKAKVATTQLQKEQQTSFQSQQLSSIRNANGVLGLGSGVQPEIKPNMAPTAFSPTVMKQTTASTIPTTINNVKVQDPNSIMSAKLSLHSNADNSIGNAQFIQSTSTQNDKNKLVASAVSTKSNSADHSKLATIGAPRSVSISNTDITASQNTNAAKAEARPIINSKIAVVSSASITNAIPPVNTSGHDQVTRKRKTMASTDVRVLTPVFQQPPASFGPPGMNYQMQPPSYFHQQAVQAPLLASQYKPQLQSSALLHATSHNMAYNQNNLPPTMPPQLSRMPTWSRNPHSPQDFTAPQLQVPQYNNGFHETSGIINSTIDLIVVS